MGRRSSARLSGLEPEVEAERIDVEDLLDEEREHEAPAAKSKRRRTEAPAPGGDRPAQGLASQPQARPSTSQSTELTEEDVEEFGKLVKHYTAVARTYYSETQEGEKGTRLVMRHVLFHQREKPDHPIRQSDLAKIVTEEVKTKGASTGIIANAQYKLIAELGLELKKIEIGPARAETKSSAKATAYVLRSALPTCLRARCPRPPPQTQHLHALAVILFKLIELCSDGLPEDAMWRYLAQLGIFPDQPHPCFGKKPSDAVEALLKKRYLRVSQAECTGDQGQAVRGFEQGEAAVDEFNKGSDLQVFEDEVFGAAVA